MASDQSNRTYTSRWDVCGSLIHQLKEIEARLRLDRSTFQNKPQGSLSVLSPHGSTDPWPRFITATLTNRRAVGCSVTSQVGSLQNVIRFN